MLAIMESPRESGATAPEFVRTPGPARVPSDRTILLVEDEDLVCRVLAEVLKSEGYHVIRARHGLEAIALAADHAGRIDLLITDVSLPHLSGWELATRLGETRGPIPVLFMSGFAPEEIAFQGQTIEGLSFLQKPFETRNFLAKIQEVLEHT